MTTQQFLYSAWNWHPVAIIGGIVLVALYVAAWPTAAQHATCETQQVASPKFKTGKRGLFLLALGIFLLTLVSPVNALADGYLFSVHMLQHLLLLLVVPALLLLAWPTRPRSAAFTPLQAQRVKAAQRSSVAAGFAAIKRAEARAPGFHIFASWLSGVGAMWFWHVPTLCDAATSYQSVRTVQIVSLLLLGTFFWQPILATQASRRLSPLAGSLYLFTACVGCTLLGIIITFAPVSVCPIYLHPMDPPGLLPLIRQNWGMTPAVDQQVGGLMMWVPACLIYLCAILALLGRYFTAADSKPQTSPKVPVESLPGSETETKPPTFGVPAASGSPTPDRLKAGHQTNPLTETIKPKASHA